jgi:uncharacterized protein YndB with AHSA1/START domain
MSTHAESNEEAGSRLGVAEKLQDGRICVRFERRLNHPIARVWSALVDRDELAKWFPEVKLEPRIGGGFEIQFGSREGSDCEGSSVVRGEIEHFDPPYLLQCGTMRWELEPDGNACVLRFSDIVSVEPSRGDNATAKSVLGGWHWYLDALEEALEGRLVDRTKPETEYAGRLL